MTTTFVDLETAKKARGMRLVVLANVPSPWSEAAKAIFHLKRLPFVAVRLGPGDRAVKEWTRVRNAPVAIYDDEPARTGWAEILELAERVAPGPSLVPKSPGERVRMFGLAHEVMGEGGLIWSGRLLTVDAGLRSGGATGFPVPIAEYLGKRYGYYEGCAAGALERLNDVLSLLREALAGREYYFGTTPTALDIYSAAAMNLLAPLPDDQCQLLPPIREAFESTRKEHGGPPEELVAHRDRLYERHLELPIAL
jgi:glutathione S-transferase